MNFYLFLIPIITGIVSLLTTFTLICILLFPKKGLLSKSVPLLLDVIRSMDNHQIREGITPLVNEKIGEFLASMTQQIPMASMILTGTFAASVKEKARGEILNMVPELKQLAADKGEKILRQKLQEYWKAGIFKYGLLVSILGGVLGIVFGAIGMLIARMII